MISLLERLSSQIKIFNNKKETSFDNSILSVTDNRAINLTEFKSTVDKSLNIMRQFFDLKSMEVMPHLDSSLSLVINDRRVPLILPVDGLIGNKTFIEKSWDLRKIEFFIGKAVNIKKQICLVDIGANIGLFSRQCASKLPNIKHAFLYEPNLENFAYLQRNIEGWNTDLVLINAAISSHDGSMPLYEDPNNCGNYSLNISAMPEQFTISEVKVISAFNEQLKWLATSCPIFYKSDTQGYDETIAVSFSLDFWHHVHCASFELWRIDKPVFDQHKFSAILDSFPYKVFDSNHEEPLHTEDIMQFLNCRDGLFNDLLCWR